MYLHIFNDTLRIDNEAAGEGQLPVVITVETDQVDTETAVYFLQIARKGKSKAEKGRDLIINICQNREGEVVLFGYLF